jgi:hypothetical protein
MNADQRIKIARAHWASDYTYFKPTLVITDKLWVGSMDDASNVDWLLANKITHVVNCGQPLYQYNERVGYVAGLKEVFVVNAEDTLGYPLLTKHLDSVISFCDNAFLDPNTRILFHCMAGINRSPTLVLAYAALRFNLHLETLIERFAVAFEGLMKLRPIIMENEDFYKELIAWIHDSS